MVLAEPDLIKTELVQQSDLLDGLRVHVAQRVVAAGRTAEVVRHAEPHRRSHATRLAHRQALRPGGLLGDRGQVVGPGPRRFDLGAEREECGLVEWSPDELDRSRHAGGVETPGDDCGGLPGGVEDRLKGERPIVAPMVTSSAASARANRRGAAPTAVPGVTTTSTSSKIALTRAASRPRPHVPTRFVGWRCGRLARAIDRVRRSRRSGCGIVATSSWMPRR